MNQTFEIERQGLITYLCLLMAIGAWLFLAYRLSMCIPAFYRKKWPAEPLGEMSKDILIVNRYIQLKLLFRMAFLFGVTYICWLLYANAFYWFSAITVTDQTVELSFAYPKNPIRFTRGSIHAASVVVRGKGGYLLLDVGTSKRWQSVRTYDLAQLREIEKELGKRP